MQCLDENAVLDLFWGALSPSRAAQVQAHIDECEACRLLVAEVARLSTVRTERASGHVSFSSLEVGRSAPPPSNAAPPPPALRAGAIIDGRHRLDRCIGEGGLGIVWAATHEAMGVAVALKFLKSKDHELTKRFAREARVTAAIAHPCIVEVHDVFQMSEGTSVMVMDLLYGESLGTRLRRGPLALDETRAVVTPVISALGTAHAAGVVHRDLKPENVFLATSGVKVLDFGLAKIMADAELGASSRLTRSGFVMGTPYYVAPEQVHADREIDHRADVWAVGVIVYECLSCQRPFHARSLGGIFRATTAGDARPLDAAAPHVPPHIVSLVARMLSRDRAHHPDLREAYDALAL
jgi:serine/threonine-protein kinase